jgi:type IV fimbrial biogenesis protein FimT
MIFTSQRGFSIIEILISLVVMGVLIGLAAPNFFAFLQNQQIRAATESTLNGLQVARAEAVRRNTPVQVVLAPPTAAWTVTRVSTGTVVQSRISEQSTASAVLATTPAGATTVTFSALGGVTANADASASVNQIDVTNAGFAAASGARPLRITVSAGGNIRMCDPALALPDPRGC